MKNLNNKKQSEINMSHVIQSIMLDYEQLANSHNTLLSILFLKGIINTSDWNNALEVQEKKKAEVKAKMKIIK